VQSAILAHISQVLDPLIASIAQQPISLDQSRARPLTLHVLLASTTMVQVVLTVNRASINIFPTKQPAWLAPQEKWPLVRAVLSV